MKIFISWSGERSKMAGEAIRDWLPLVLHYAEPWLSARDIAAGDRWALEIGKELDASNYGILVLTPENLVAPWILFEAGAVSKAFSVAAVCPYLIEVDVKDVTGPLSQFQCKKADKSSTLELLRAIDSKSDVHVPAGRIIELFEALWPRLAGSLAQLPVMTGGSTPASRGTGEVLEELVQATRKVDSTMSQLGFEFDRRLEFLYTQLMPFLGSAPRPSSRRHWIWRSGRPWNNRHLIKMANHGLSKSDFDEVTRRVALTPGIEYVEVEREILLIGTSDDITLHQLLADFEVSGINLRTGVISSDLIPKADEPTIDSDF